MAVDIDNRSRLWTLGTVQGRLQRCTETLSGIC